MPRVTIIHKANQRHWWYARYSKALGMTFDVELAKDGKHMLKKTSGNDVNLGSLVGTKLKNLRGLGCDFTDCYILERDCAPINATNKDVAKSLLRK